MFYFADFLINYYMKTVDIIVGIRFMIVNNKVYSDYKDY